MRAIDLSFPKIKFNGTLRPSQEDVVSIANAQLQSGERRLHIVAPPGSGKTVLGLFLWAEVVRRPCLVLSPNSAIQSQWAARTDLFEIHDDRNIVSTDNETPGLLTSLTYQSVTMPARNNQSIESQAQQLWSDTLVEDQQAASESEAGLWIEDLRTNNFEYYSQRLASYEKKIRDEISRQGESLSTLHASSIATLERLAEKDVGLLILDECHHLLGHWGRVLSDATKLLDNPIIVGLTATPPDRGGKDPRDLERYDRFFGGIDFEVPVPAVVKDGFLAPYQDLVYFVRPSNDELQFVASADERLEELVAQLCQPISNDATAEKEGEGDQVLNLIEWTFETLKEMQLPTFQAKSWSQFSRRDPGFSLAGRQFLLSRNRELPDAIPRPSILELPEQVPEIEYLIPVLDRYVRHYLRRSEHPDLRELAQDVIANLRLLGVQITETGSQACASPVSRVLAYSQSKAQAIVEILLKEMEVLGDSIRSVVITDFEKTSAVTAEIEHLMDDETGGAIAAFKSILQNPSTDQLDPILLTGSTILIDDEIEERFLVESNQWLKERKLQVELKASTIDNFRLIRGSGRDWAPRVFVQMITELFQRGLTKCLVGTRGLLGEGWDADKINVLIDLTTVTTSMSINQLRGRSIRLDAERPEKLSNNWDVVCIAPEFNKGFDDYHRFIDKHKSLYGVTDDATVEKGVGHVHPALTEIRPEGLESSVSVFNSEMLARAAKRDQVREFWKIGQPFQSLPIHTVEAKLENEGLEFSFPPFAGAQSPWSDQSLTQAISESVLATFVELGWMKSGLTPDCHTIAGGYVRVFLESADEEQTQRFSQALCEVLGPLDRPRYVIERIVEFRTDTLLSKILPSIFGRYFVRKHRELAMLHAVPSEFAKNKKNVEIFQTHWNRLVSPGEAFFAFRGEGKKRLEDAKNAGQSQTRRIHEKQVFI